jgi:voltage-gated potassium channel
MIIQLMRFFREEVVHRSRNVPARVTILMVALMSYSVTGYMFFEIVKKPELSWDQALWWSIVTMTTVGYGDMYPESFWGRYLIAVPTMLIGIGLLGFVLSVVATKLIEARTNQLRGLSKVRMKKHIVICNYPSRLRVLDLVEQIRADESTHSTGIVLLDDDLEELPADLEKHDVHFVRGDPAKAETLRKAEIKTARGALVMAKDPQDPRSDHRSLAVLLTIETVNEACFTVAELVETSNREFFERTGCDAIVCLQGFTTHIMVQELLDPGVQGVIDQLVSTAYGQQIFVVPLESSMSKTYRELREWSADQEALLLGFERNDKTEINPRGRTKIVDGDKLIFVATKRPVCKFS